VKRIIIFLVLLLIPTFAHAERIELVLSPDISAAPWCKGIVFELSLDVPDQFPSPILCYETTHADLNVATIQTLLDEYGMPKPEKEKWYNGPDDLNKRNYVFCEKNNAYHALFAYPWGMKRQIKNHDQEEKLQIAANRCHAFLQAASITGIEEPYHVIIRNHDYEAGNSLGKNPAPDAYTLSLDKQRRIDGDKYTGIGFRFELGNLPLAIQSFDNPAIDTSNATHFDCWGQMTIRDDGAITKLELWNYRTIKRELDAYSGPVCSWQDAVDAMLDMLIHHTIPQQGKTEESHWLDDYTHLKITDVEPSLALTPSGKTFPVWTITHEYKQAFDDGSHYYGSGTLYVNAVTGSIAEQNNNEM